MKIQKAPNWEKYINEDFLRKAFSSSELKTLQKKAQKDYMYWDTFKYQNMPDCFTPEEAWSFIKLERTSLYQETPVMSTDGKKFQLAITNTLNQKLNFIDINASGLKMGKISEAQKNKFILTGLTEEAIATSQLEGANTTRKIAKEMLASQRQPKTKDEQMIINSYQMMEKLTKWKDLGLSEEMLLEIQTTVTEKTLEDIKDQGRFRKDSDEIVVKDRIADEIVHIPPVEKEMHLELKKLIEFANKPEEDDGGFMHPVVKATILQFWIAYLHPFVDGNGRTARAVFYWYLLKHNYWLVEYLTISRAIVNSKKGYDNSFIYSENENDLTYFVFYIADILKTSIIKFIEYFNEKIKEIEEFKKVADKLEDYNPRQVALLKYFLNNDSYSPAEVKIHQSKHGVSPQTAHSDLIELTQKGLLSRTIKKRKYIYMPNIEKIKKLFTI